CAITTNWDEGNYW
nr:immunoglobulin heavy chain junction region [Mus musculus]